MNIEHFAPPAYCSKCKGRVNDWASLPLVGIQVFEGDDEYGLEMRNCACGTTLSTYRSRRLVALERSTGLELVEVRIQRFRTIGQRVFADGERVYEIVWSPFLGTWFGGEPCQPSPF